MGNIQIENIICTADRDQGDITSLANSIDQLGLLQPILLRSLPDGKYEVVDGRRRFTAIKKLEWKVLPDRAYTFTPPIGDPAVMAHVANVERKNLTPAEEVRQLAELAQTHSTERLAGLFGRTPGWIARRLKISTLIPEWLKVLDNPEMAQLWTLDKLALIARQSESIQKKLLFMANEYDKRSYSIDTITSRINSYNRQISGAIFDMSDCEKCRNNTATNELLFDDSDGKDGICMDEDCWLKKTLARIKTILKDEKLIPIQGDNAGWYKADIKYAEKINAKRKYEFSKIRFPKQGEAANGLIVCGDDIGRRVVAVIRKETDAPIKPVGVKPLTIEEQEAILKQKRNKKALELLREEFLKDDFVEKMRERTMTNQTDHFLTCLYLWGHKGMMFREYGVFEIDRITIKPDVDLSNFLTERFYPQIVSMITEQIRHELMGTLSKISPLAGPALCELFKLDWKTFLSAAVAEIPEPKSLTEAKKAQKGRKTAK